MRVMKNRLLDKMGITQWFLRERSVNSSCFCVRLNSADGRLIGLLLADKDDQVLQHEQESTLQKIADALSPHSQCEIIFDLSQDLIKKNNAQFFISLGDQVSKIKFDGTHIQSYSLKNLMSNTEYKKQLWQQIKPLCDLFI